jgi:benzoate/toluate 1,2-dioxygenase reductase subunit
LKKKAALTTPDHPDKIQSVELLQRRWLSKNAFEIELTRPPALEFKAGQTICFIHESMTRYYSLISTPDDATLEFCVYYVPRGNFSTILADASIGSPFQVSGPHGYFTFNRSDRAPIFIATGTGIAPFVSFARSGITDFTLLHQAVSVDELYYRLYFQKITPRYFSCLTEVPFTESSLPNLFCGKISECIRKNLRPGSYDFYLCGEREMLREVTLLVDGIYPESRVYTEVFY